MSVDEALYDFFIDAAHVPAVALAPVSKMSCGPRILLDRA